MIFIDNKYTKTYYAIIDRATKELRTKKSETYYEKHHIIPQSLNGTDDKTNLVLLTAYEHLKVHMLLPYMTVSNARSKMLWAFNAMITHNNSKWQHRVEPNTLTEDDLQKLAELRIEYSKINGRNCKIIDPDGNVVSGYSVRGLARKVDLHLKYVAALVRNNKTEYKGWRRYSEDLIGVKSSYDPYPIKLITPGGKILMYEKLLPLTKKYNMPYCSLYKLHRGEIDNFRGWKQYKGPSGP